MQLVWHPVAVVQYTFTHKQYIEQHAIRKSAGRSSPLPVLLWHLPWKWGKSTEKSQSEWNICCCYLENTNNSFRCRWTLNYWFIMYAYVCMYLHIYVYMYVCMWVGVYICVFVCVFIYVYIIQVFLFYTACSSTSCNTTCVDISLLSTSIYRIFIFRL